MKSVFIADTHLRDEGQEGYRYVLDFLDGLRGRINHLFIAGDFFDFWFCGNGNIYPPFQKAVDRLLVLRDSGARIHLFEGNHDFSMGPCFAGQEGLDVFPDWADMTIDGNRIFISHGDTVDAANIRYLTLRKMLRSRTFLRVQEMVPPAVLWKLAAFSSSLSKGLTLESQDKLAGKMNAFALTKFQEGFDTVIFGHCHRPVLKQYDIGGRTKTFAAVGDWIDHYSYLLFEGGGFTLSFYRP
jgi:UDP-2,3-diacylglucosamine hydrolase